MMEVEMASRTGRWHSGMGALGSTVRQFRIQVLTATSQLNIGNYLTSLSLYEIKQNLPHGALRYLRPLARCMAQSSDVRMKLPPPGEGGESCTGKGPPRLNKISKHSSWPSGGSSEEGSPATETRVHSWSGASHVLWSNSARTTTTEPVPPEPGSHTC